MKQLGNLAIVCAQRPDLLLQVYEGYVCVYVGEGPDRTSLLAKWDDDQRITDIIQMLNYGEYATRFLVSNIGRQAA